MAYNTENATVIQICLAGFGHTSHGREADPDVS